MIKLNKNCVYSLEGLTSEEKQQLLEKLIELDNTWNVESSKLQLFSSNYLYFSDRYIVIGEWLVSQEKPYTSKETINAKELFYTLENVQVDCRELTEERIKEMANVFEANGFKIWEDYSALDVSDVNYLLEFTDGEFFVSIGSEEKTTITYEKFMELFAEPQYEVKYISEEPKETFNPQPHYNNDKGSLYKVAEDRNWNAYLFDVVKRLERGGKKDPLEQEIQKSIDVLKLWLIEATQ